jgi:lysophospholipase L1-like esterase
MRDRIVHGLRGLWINIGIALLVLIVLEGAFQLGFGMRHRSQSDSSLINGDRLAAANPGQQWVRGYPSEARGALREQWWSYVYWRLRPYRGAYININERGIRQTWNASAAPAPDQPKVFMFGGSTMWGWGARDEFTIPSLVSKGLAETMRPSPWVVNYGETGYVSTQDVITLALELRRGNVPAVVVFYDGVNDAWAAFQSRVAGQPQNEFNRISEFNSRDRLNWREGLLGNLALFRFARGVMGSVGTDSPETSRRRFLEPPLATAVVDAYLGNVRTVNALARQYGFRAVYFWQPTIFSKTTLSADEARWGLTGARRPGRGAPAFAEEYQAFNGIFRERLRTSKLDNVIDLSGIFENDPRTIFFDRFHVSEAGNAKLADVMVPRLRQVVKSSGR